MANRVEHRYTDPSAPGSFQGPNKLYQSAKSAGEPVKKEEVSDYLRTEDTYTLNRVARRRFPQNRTVVEGIDDLWDGDLADLIDLHKQNDGVKYLLVVVDAFSRYMWVKSLKTKFSKEVASAFDEIFAEGRLPNKIRTDLGKEFHNKAVRDKLSEHGVHLIAASNHAVFAERGIQTLKSKLFRYLIHENNLRYIDVLQDLVKSYNTTVHSSIGRPPATVTKQNESEVRIDEYQRRRKPKNDSGHPRQEIKFKVGDKVRVSLAKEVFDREYSQRWSGEIFTVASVKRRETIPVYKLKDWFGEPVNGTYYTQELQKVDVTDRTIFKVEKEEGRRLVGGREQVLIKWKYWPKKFNTWEWADQIKEI